MFHIHLYNKVVYNDRVDSLLQCRCGSLVHKELSHRYNEKRTYEQTHDVGIRLVKQYKKDLEQITYRTGVESIKR